MDVESWARRERRESNALMWSCGNGVPAVAIFESVHRPVYLARELMMQRWALVLL
jgi:hypothetical protein